MKCHGLKISPLQGIELADFASYFHPQSLPDDATVGNNQF